MAKYWFRRSISDAHVAGEPQQWGDRELETLRCRLEGKQEAGCLADTRKGRIAPFSHEKPLSISSCKKQLNYWIFTTPHRSACLALTFKPMDDLLRRLPGQGYDKGFHQSHCRLSEKKGLEACPPPALSTASSTPDSPAHNTPLTNRASVLSRSRVSVGTEGLVRA